MASVFLLCLDNNQLSGSVPTSLGNLTKLETMYVLDNDTEQRGVCVCVILILRNTTVCYKTIL
jgi:hypothetical protein